MKTKIAIVIPTLHGAGCEKLLSEMLFYFEKEFDIDLILYEKNIDYNIPKNINIKLVGTDNSPYHSKLYKVYRLFKRINNIGKILKSNDYKAIVSFIDGCNTNVYLAKLLYRIKIPLISAEHTINENFFNNNPFTKKFKSLFKWLLKTTYNGVDEVIVISNSMKKYLIKNIGVKNQNISVIYNGIDTNKFNLEKNKNVDFEKEFKESKIKLLNVARLDDNKNQQYLINLMPAILKEYPDAKLFIIGKGEKEKELKELINRLHLNSNVYLLGWKTNVSIYMKEVDVFLMSSKYESFGNVVVESLSCGVPVVTSRYDDVLFDIIEDDNFGKIIELDNNQEYINAIKHFINQKPKKEILHSSIRKKFDIKNTSFQYINVIKKVINEQAVNKYNNSNI